MSGKFLDRGDFDIPSAVFDEADWIIDAFLDGIIGKNCTLVYPPKSSECTNCVFDLRTGRSSGLYKAGGPYSFIVGDVCPVCGGEGLSLLPQEETIKLRVYWSNKDWIRISPPLNIPNALAQVIGYMVDLPKLERAKEVILDSDFDQYKRWRVQRAGEAVPWGFQRRYFVQFMERISGV